MPALKTTKGVKQWFHPGQKKQDMKVLWCRHCFGCTKRTHYIAVSYTHLDVYKRQRLSSPDSIT